MDPLEAGAEEVWHQGTAEITGADGGPVQTEELSSLEIARRVAFLLVSAAKDQESR